MLKYLITFFIFSLQIIASSATSNKPSVPYVGFEQKKLLDAVKNGVVMVETKAYLSLERETRSSWVGSGFLIDKKNGIIVTNRHVAGDMAVCTYEVKFGNGVKVKAHFLYADPLYDIAFLKVDFAKIPTECVALEFASEKPAVNQEIYAMGNSAADEFSTFKGTIFTIYDNIGPFNEQSFRFSGMTVGGASGSPVFNTQGKVLGILYGGKFVSGAALPIDYVKRALDHIAKHKLPPRHSVGVLFEYKDIDLVKAAGCISKDIYDLYKKEFPDAQNKILMVNTRIAHSPASQFFHPGDVLWSVNGKKVGPHLHYIDEALDSSKQVIFEIYRNGKLHQFKMNTYVLENAYALRFVSFAGAVWYTNHELQRMLTGEHKDGVYIISADATSAFKDVFKESTWSSRPIRIAKINGYDINTLDDLKRIMPQLKKETIFTVTYVDYMGESTFGGNVSADRQERFVIVKYDNRFDTPKSFVFNKKTLQWDVATL